MGRREDERTFARQASGALTEDDVNGLAIRCVDKMVEMGLIKDCRDTDQDSEFVAQDIIAGEITAAVERVGADSGRSLLDPDEFDDLVLDCVAGMVKAGLVEELGHSENEDELRVIEIISEVVDDHGLNMRPRPVPDEEKEQ